MPTWSPTRPLDETWKAPAGLPHHARAAEQDHAAGSHERRLITIEQRRVCASVALRVQPNSRRIYAYLRWSDHGKTIERYLGPVDQQSRAENLKQAWQRAANPLADVTVVT